MAKGKKFVIKPSDISKNKKKAVDDFNRTGSAFKISLNLNRTSSNSSDEGDYILKSTDDRSPQQTIDGALQFLKDT
jgi:hypothetical protein